MKFQSPSLFAATMFVAASSVTGFAVPSSGRNNVAFASSRPLTPTSTSTTSLASSSSVDNSNDVASSELLSRPERPGRPLKVAIAGGGVGGLTTALCLLRKGVDVTVYERTAAFARFGGPIQFASNALSVLAKIDGKKDGLFDRVMERFTFTGTRACGIKDGLRANGEFRMTDDRLDYVLDENAPADWFVRFPLKGCADLFGLPYTGVINRPDLQDVLVDECKKIKPDFIQNGNAVADYETKGKGKGVTVTLEDGQQHDADLLIGSDGIWSTVRARMYGEEVKKSSANLKKRQGCSYSGYTVFAGETVIKTPDYYETGYKVYIGPKRYFVTSDVGDGRVQWYAFFALPPGTKKAASGWGGSTGSIDPNENLVEYIKRLHDGWSDEVMTVLDATPPESVEQRDLYDRPPELLRSWADGNVVLVGDAVHPMMPNLGQGGCQAIEDAYVLSEMLENVESTDGIEDALQEFYRKRIVRVSIVQFLSRLASDLIINAFDTPWSPHDNLGTSWKSYLTFFWKPLLRLVIFPAQFAYLYSYHPTGDMGDVPKRLEEKWRTKHVESSEQAFEKVRTEGQVSSGPSFFQSGGGSSGSDAAADKPLTVMSAKKET